MERHQHIMKLQSELMKEKKFIDHKLDEAIAKQCHLEKAKYRLLLKVVIPTISSHVKITTVNKAPKPAQHILSKRPLTDTEKGNMPKNLEDVVIYDFHDELDDSKILTSELNSTETLL